MGTHQLVLLLGAPGSGKGTQAIRLAQELGIPHVASGDLLRAHHQRGIDQSAMDHGDLVPDELVTTMVLQRLAEPDAAGGAVLDGYPRDVPQAEALDRALAADHSATLRAIYLDVPAAALVGRLAGRRTCPECQASYHVEANPPRQAGRCDQCNVALVHRPDDCAEVVRHRVEVYLRETLPVIEHYMKLGVLQRVDGNQQIEILCTELDRMTHPPAVV